MTIKLTFGLPNSPQSLPNMRETSSTCDNNNTRKKKEICQRNDRFFHFFVRLTIVMVNCCVPLLPTYHFPYTLHTPAYLVGPTVPGTWSVPQPRSQQCLVLVRTVSYHRAYQGLYYPVVGTLARPRAQQCTRYIANRQVPQQQFCYWYRTCTRCHVMIGPAFDVIGPTVMYQVQQDMLQSPTCTSYQLYQVPYQVHKGKPTHARKMVPGPSRARKIGLLALHTLVQDLLPGTRYCTMRYQ